MRALEPTTLRPRDDDFAAAHRSWDIKFKSCADRVDFSHWLVESNVSLDFVHSCDDKWLFCSSVDGIKVGDPIFFVGEMIGGIIITDIAAAVPALYYIFEVSNSKISVSMSPGSARIHLTPHSSGAIMFMCMQPSLPLPPCIQRHPELYKSLDVLCSHQVFAADSDQQRKQEWL
jgi:hypothetical protein